jgi:hypothetical protein
MAVWGNALRALSVAGWVGATALGAVSPAAAEPDTCDPQVGVANSCAGQPPQTWPIAQGDFTSPGDPGWVFFGPYGCGIGPDGTIGCDRVPARWPDGTPVEAGQPGPPGSYSCEGSRCPLPPPGANQIVAGAQQPAEYVQSAIPTFTRDVDDLPEGYRLANGDAWCAVGYQGSVSCTSGQNGFVINTLGAILEAP